MKSVTSYKVILVLILLLKSYQGNCQYKEIELTKFYRKTVPTGKVWFINNTSSYKIAISKGSFISGTACNSAFNSNPNFTLGIVCFDTVTQLIQLPKVFGFTMKEAPQLLHDDIYLIKPYFLLRNGCDENNLKYSLVWNYQSDEIVFYPGMKLETSNCINSLTLYERDFTLKDKRNLIEETKKKNDAKISLQKLRAENKLLYERQKNEKFNAKVSIYKLSEISNSKNVFTKSKLDSACKLIADAIKSYADGNLEKYERNIFPYQAPLEVIVQLKWDTLGNVIMYEVQNREHINKILLDSILNFNTAPILAYENSVKKAFVEDYLTFNVTYDIKESDDYEVKKIRKGYRFIRNNFDNNKITIESKLDNMGLLAGAYYNVNFSKIGLTVQLLLPNGNTESVKTEDNCVSILKLNVF